MGQKNRKREERENLKKKLKGDQIDLTAKSNM